MGGQKASIDAGLVAQDLQCAAQHDEELHQQLSQMLAQDRAEYLTNQRADDSIAILVAMSNEDRESTILAMPAETCRVTLPMQRGPTAWIEELQIDMQCFVSYELQCVVFGIYTPLLWLMHGFFFVFQLAAQLWVSTCKGGDNSINHIERMVTQGILVPAPTTPIVLMFEVAFCGSVLFLMFDLEFQPSVVIAYCVYAVLHGVFLTYFMIVRPKVLGYQVKGHESGNLRKMDPR